MIADSMDFSKQFEKTFCFVIIKVCICICIIQVSIFYRTHFRFHAALLLSFWTKTVRYSHTCELTSDYYLNLRYMRNIVKSFFIKLLAKWVYDANTEITNVCFYICTWQLVISLVLFFQPPPPKWTNYSQWV